MVERSSATSQADILRLRIAAGLISMALMLPLPGMIAFTNPDQGAVLGRYTASYGLMLLGWSLLVAACLGATFWIWKKLSANRLANIRHWMGAHDRLVIGMAIITLIAYTALRVMLILGMLPRFPDSFAGIMNALPEVLLVLGLYGLVQLIDPPTAELLSRHLPRLSRRWLLIPIAVVVIVCLFVASAPRYWENAVTFDPSVHLYLGQQLLAGNPPYTSVVYFHPPVRFLVSGAWNLVARISGLDAVTAARGTELAGLALTIVVLYLIGQKVTEGSVGGLLTVGLFLGLDLWAMNLIEGPTFRQATVLFVLLGVLAALYRRWGWSGICLTLAALMYAPAGLALVMVGLILIIGEWSDLKSFLRPFAIGIGAVLAVLAVWLLASGSFRSAFNQSVVALAAILFNTGGPAWDATDPEWGLTYWIGEYAYVSWIIFGLFFVLKDMVRDFPRWKPGVVVLGAVLAAAVLFYSESGGSVRDALPFMTLVSVLGAIGLLRFIGRWADTRWYGLVVIVVTICLSAIGLADLPAIRDEELGRTDLTLRQQQMMALELSQALEEGETVQMLGSAWYLVLADETNATPFIQNQDLAIAAAAADHWTTAEIVAAVRAKRPTVIMSQDWFAGSNVQTDLIDDYVVVGRLRLAEGKRQRIYVRADQTDLIAMIAAWPVLEP